MESAYRIDGSDRTLWGYSLGGIFVLYALFQHPELFRRYGVADGLHEAFFAIDQSYASQHDRLPARLFLSSGGDPAVPQFLATLQSRNYSGLELASAVLNGDGHFTVPAEGLTKGLVVLFGK